MAGEEGKVSSRMDEHTTYFTSSNITKGRFFGARHAGISSQSPFLYVGEERGFGARNQDELLREGLQSQGNRLIGDKGTEERGREWEGKRQGFSLLTSTTYSFSFLVVDMFFLVSFFSFLLLFFFFFQIVRSLS